MKLLPLVVLVALPFVNPVAVAADTGIKPGKFFVGSSAFMLANFDDSDTNPEFSQLNLGYRLTAKDVISLEYITWKYHAPLGIPYGDAKDDKAERYPGHAESTGIALAYQRFLTGKVYTAIHTAFFDQVYRDEAGNQLSTGDQVFMTFRLGYHFSFWGDRIFVEPSIAATYWPHNTGLPPSFKAKEDKWPNYFLFEPGLHFGFAF